MNQITFDILMRYTIILPGLIAGRFDFERISKSVLRLLRTARKKYEQGSLFNIKIPVLFQVGYYVLLTAMIINYILRLLMTSMLYYMLQEDDV